MLLKSRILALGLALLLVGSASAGEVDRYLPADTEVYNVVNIRQILGSALVKNTVGVDKIRDLINSVDEAKTILKDLALDPLKDIDRIISAGPATGEQDKGLMIITGRFDVDKWRARAAKEAKDNKDVVKVHKLKDGQGGEHTVYELVLAEALPNLPPGANLSLFVGFASKNTILASVSKDYLIDGLKVKDDTRAKLKNKAFQEMIEKMDEKQSFATVMNAEALAKAQGIEQAPQQVKDILSKLATVNLGITLTDGIRLEASAGAKNADDARALRDQLKQGLDAGKGLLLLAGMGNPQLEPLKDFVDSIKVTLKDKVISLKGEVSGEALLKLIPKDQ